METALRILNHFRFAREHDGISISFNGNDYPLGEAQIAIVSPSAIATAVIANIYANNDKKSVLLLLMIIIIQIILKDC